MAKIPGEFVPLSTRYRRDRSIRRAGVMAEVVFIRSLALAKREETNGVIEDYDIAELTEDVPDPDAAIKALVNNRLWSEIGDHSWIIRSWQKWNPSDESSISGKYGNHIRWHLKEGVTNPDCHWCETATHGPDVGSGIAPDSPPDIAPDVGSGIAPDSQVRVDLDLEKKRSSSSEEDGNPEPKRRAKNTYTEEFEQWWANYPHKKGSKFNASKQFPTARKLTDLETLIRTAIAYGKNTDRQFILDGERWLKGRRWEDAQVIQMTRPQDQRPAEYALPEIEGTLFEGDSK